VPKFVSFNNNFWPETALAVPKKIETRSIKRQQGLFEGFSNAAAGMMALGVLAH
jgi:hypothetical protein